MNSRRFIRSSSQLEETGAEYHVSMVVALTTGAYSPGMARGDPTKTIGHARAGGEKALPSIASAILVTIKR